MNIFQRFKIEKINFIASYFFYSLIYTLKRLWWLYALIYSCQFIILPKAIFSSHIHYLTIHNSVKIAVKIIRRMCLAGVLVFFGRDEKINFNNIPMRVDRKLSTRSEKIRKELWCMQVISIEFIFKL